LLNPYNFLTALFFLQKLFRLVSFSLKNAVFGLAETLDTFSQ